MMLEGQLESRTTPTDTVPDETNLFGAKKGKRGEFKKMDVLFRRGQVLYLLPYRFFLLSKLMPPQQLFLLNTVHHFM